MVEYHIDPHLLEMANEVRGKPDRFLHLHVKFGKKTERTFELSGDKEDLIDTLTNIVKKGNARVITQAIGTYSKDE